MVPQLIVFVVLILSFEDSFGFNKVDKTDSNCWWLEPYRGDHNTNLPPNVCSGSGWGLVRNISNMYKIITNSSIQYGEYSNGNCSGIPHSTKWYNKSDGFKMNIDLINGKDCGVVNRNYNCGYGTPCADCNPSGGGDFYEFTDVTGICTTKLGPPY